MYITTPIFRQYFKTLDAKNYAIKAYLGRILVVEYNELGLIKQIKTNKFNLLNVGELGLAICNDVGDGQVNERTMGLK